MWNMKCFVVILITEDTGNVIKGLKKYLETIPRKYLIESPRETAAPGTSLIIRESTQTEISSLSAGVHHWFKRRSIMGKKL
jgi:hypothetical protein